MFNLSLTACSFLLKKPYSHDKYYYLNHDIEINNDAIKSISVLDMFVKFFDAYTDSVDDTDRRKTFHCLYDNANVGETETYHYIYSLIKSGSYGSSSEVVDNNTKKVVHTLKPNQTVEKPFYLYIVIPKDNKRVQVQKGMFFFQNVGQYGIKTITTEYMRKFFFDEYNIKLECKTIASKLFLERMLKKDNISKIIMTKNHKSGDSADALCLGYGVETRVIGNLAFDEGRWTKIKKRIDYFAQGKDNLFEFDNLKYDGLKLNIEIGGRLRTINMNNIDNLSLIEGIPDEIQGADGHPKKKLLLEHFAKVANEYLQEMVLQIN